MVKISISLLISDESWALPLSIDSFPVEPGLVVVPVSLLMFIINFFVNVEAPVWIYVCVAILISVAFFPISEVPVFALGVPVVLFISHVIVHRHLACLVVSGDG